MFLLLKELLQPDGLPARTHPLGRGVFNETPSPSITESYKSGLLMVDAHYLLQDSRQRHFYLHSLIFNVGTNSE